MGNYLISFINEYKVLATVIVSIFTTAFISFKHWISLTDYLKYKKINHFAKLLSEPELNDELKASIKNAKNEAIFQNLLGYSANRKMIEATCKLFNQGNLSLQHIKIFYKFLRLDDEVLHIKLSKDDTILAWVSGFMILIGFIYFALLSFLAFNLNTAKGNIGAILMLIMFFLYLFLIGGDLRRYLIAKRVKKKFNL